jgi:septum formation protein
VLASASPRRLDLLRQIGVEPQAVVAADLDETPHPAETPRTLAARLAASKAAQVARDEPDAFVVGSDTVVALGRRVLPKAESDDEVRACLDLLSGRSHRVFTAVTVFAPGGRSASRVAECRVRFKRLSGPEVEGYVLAGEGLGKAGGYAIQGRAGAFVISVQGSYPAVVGLPLYETACLLNGLGCPIT